MGDNVVIELLVNKLTADEISKKGLAEIALRRSNAKFKSIIKCKVLGTPVGTASIPSENIFDSFNEAIYHNSLSSCSKINMLLRELNNSSSDSNNKLTGITAALNNMSLNVDNIYGNLNYVKTLSFLNVGLGLANLASSVIGLVIIGKKINELNAGIQQILSEVQKITNIQKNEIVSECRTLVMRYNMISDSISNGEHIQLNDFQDLLILFNAFINKILDNLNDESLDIEIVSEMVYTLMPAYTILLKEFLTRYYLSYGRFPANYENFVELYDRVIDETFEKAVQDYYMLEMEYTYPEFLDVIGAQSLLSFNNRIVIEDQIHLLELIGTESNLKLFETEIEKIAKSRIDQLIPEVASNVGIDERELKAIFS